MVVGFSAASSSTLWRQVSGVCPAKPMIRSVDRSGRPSSCAVRMARRMTFSSSPPRPASRISRGTRDWMPTLARVRPMSMRALNSWGASAMEDGVASTATSSTVERQLG